MISGFLKTPFLQSSSASCDFPLAVGPIIQTTGLEKFSFVDFILTSPHKDFVNIT